MKRKMVWLILSCLMVTALVLSSCGPAAVEEEKETETVTGKVTEKETAKVEEEEEEAPVVVEGKDMVTVSLTKRDGTTVQVTKERPRYGGTITMTGSNPRYIDGIYGLNYWTPCKWTNEALNEDKWEWGPSGTGEFEFFSFG